MVRDRDPNPNRENRLVTCPACGQTLARTDAREYDKFGDRWDRRDKTFEYFCRDCHDGLSLQGRDELEALLCEVRTDRPDRRTFLHRYARTVEERYGRLDDQ